MLTTLHKKPEAKTKASPEEKSIGKSELLAQEAAFFQMKARILYEKVLAEDHLELTRYFGFFGQRLVIVIHDEQDCPLCKKQKAADQKASPT